MLKITNAVESNARILRLEGRLTAPWIPELERAAAELVRDPSAPRLDLARLSYVDEAGASALARLLEQRFTVLAASPFVREQLLRSARAEGEPESVEVLVRAHAGRMLATAMRLLEDEVAAARAVQAAFRAVLEQGAAGASGEGGETLWPLLCHHTLRAVIAELRARAARTPAIEELLPTFDAHGQWQCPWSPEPLEPAADEPERVRACVARLPIEHRLVLALREGEGLGTGAIAELLALTPALVKTRLHQARMALCRLLTDGSAPRLAVG